MIAVIDVSGNNLASLANALKRLGYAFELTHSPDVIKKASHVILPGVGTASRGMRALQEHGLVEVIKQLAQPLLGICLGMQLLLEHSEEGDVDCLGLIPGCIKQLNYQKGYPVPHMGWNQLQWKKDSPLQLGLNNHDSVYFVHSYALQSKTYALASCEYSETFSAVIQKNHVYGMQFHPEKSAKTGLKLLNNFLTIEV